MRRTWPREEWRHGLHSDFGDAGGEIRQRVIWIAWRGHSTPTLVWLDRCGHSTSMRGEPDMVDLPKYPVLFQVDFKVEETRILVLDAAMLPRIRGINV